MRYTQETSKIGLQAGSKRRKSILAKRVVLVNTSPLRENRFAAAFNPAWRPIFEVSWVYFITLILAVIGFACQSSSEKKFSSSVCKVVKINIGDEPQTLDPRKARDLSSQTISRMLFEGLTRINPEEKAELALAESVHISPDLKTYTFHLENSVWSNGDPVTASDFVYAWKKILSPDFPSDTASHLYVIKNGKGAKDGKIPLDEIGVRVIDSKTLVVELENPTPYFLDLLAVPAFFPVNQKVDEKNPSWALSADTYVSNGPFLLSGWKHQDHLTVKKNDKYWDAKTVHIASIELSMLEAEAELKLFEKGELDWVGSPLSILPLDAIKGLRNEGSLKTKELLGTHFIRANTEHAFFKDPKLRKALALAINRKEIVDHVTQGNQIPATGLVPTSLNLQDEPYFLDGDIEKAKVLFSEVKASLRGDLPEISFMYRCNERSHLIAQVIQQQWFEAFGIRVRLESVEGKVFFDRTSKQDYQLAMGSWIADFPDAINFLEIFKYKNGGSNNTLWENPRFTELLSESALVADSNRRLEILKQSERILMEEMPIIPIFYYTMLYVNKPALKDVFLSSMGQIDFKWARIAQGDSR